MSSFFHAISFDTRCLYREWLICAESSKGAKLNYRINGTSQWQGTGSVSWLFWTQHPLLNLCRSNQSAITSSTGEYAEMQSCRYCWLCLWNSVDWDNNPEMHSHTKAAVNFLLSKSHWDDADTATNPVWITEDPRQSVLDVWRSWLVIYHNPLRAWNYIHLDSPAHLMKPNLLNNIHATYRWLRTALTWIQKELSGEKNRVPNCSNTFNAKALYIHRIIVL